MTPLLIQRIAAALRRQPVYKFQIVSMGFDGRERSLHKKFYDLTIANIVCNGYRHDFPGIPFDVRPVRC